MKTFLAALAAMALVGGASAGDKEWKEATKAQLEANAAAMVGLYEAEDMEMGPEGAMVASESRVEISYEDGVMKGRWDDGADGTWDGDWIETYQDGGYVMSGEITNGEDVMVKSYLADYVDPTHFKLKDKYTATWEDGNDYDHIVYMTVDGDTGKRKVKARPAGSDSEWVTVFKSNFSRVSGDS